MMGEMQQSAGLAYKSLNANFSAQDIRRVTMTLEKQRALYLQKTELIDETNESLMNEILEDADDSNGAMDGSRLEDEFQEYVKLSYDRQLMNDKELAAGASAGKGTKSQFDQVLDEFFGEKEPSENKIK